MTADDNRNKLISFFKPSHHLVLRVQWHFPSDVLRTSAIVSLTLRHVQSKHVLKPLSMETSPALHEL